MAQTSYTHSELVDLWLLAGGSAASADVAAAIAQAESGGCLYAKAGPNDDRPVKICTYRQTDGENSYGLWQINQRAHPQYSAATLYTALGNAGAAVQIANGGTSFGPWSTYMNGAYKQFLGAGAIAGGLTGEGTTPVPDLRPAEAFGGYADLRQSLSKHLPKQIYYSRKYTDAALRVVGRRSRVKGGH